MDDRQKKCRGYGLLALRMEVYPADGSLHLVEADIVEPFKARTGNGPYAMIRDEEVFLSSHEDVFPLGEVAVGEIGSFGLLGQRAPGRESGPMVHIGLLRCSPCLVSSLEGVLRSDDFAFEERRQSRMILREAYNPTK